VKSNQVVELITGGRSGSIGLQPGAEPEEEAAELAEGGELATVSEEAAK
jgi:hypothetical protein